MVFGYARVSTGKPTTDHQLDDLRSYGCDKIYEEKVSGTKADRPQLNALLSQLRSGDVLVIYELKRLGRRAMQLLELAEEFQRRGVELVSLTENINTTTPMGRYIFATWCALAQLDRDIIAENTRAGLEAARARGHFGGRPPAKKADVETALKLYDTGKFSGQEISNQTGLSVSTLYRYLRLREEGESQHGTKAKHRKKQ